MAKRGGGAYTTMGTLMGVRRIGGIHRNRSKKGTGSNKQEQYIINKEYSLAAAGNSRQ